MSNAVLVRNVSPRCALSRTPLFPHPVCEYRKAQGHLSCLERVSWACVLRALLTATVSACWATSLQPSHVCCTKANSPSLQLSPSGAHCAGPQCKVGTLVLPWIPATALSLGSHGLFRGLAAVTQPGQTFSFSQACRGAGAATCGQGAAAHACLSFLPLTARR